MKKVILALFILGVTAGIVCFSGCGEDKKGKPSAAIKIDTKGSMPSDIVAVGSSAGAVPGGSTPSWSLRRESVVAYAAPRYEGKSRARLHQEIRQNLGGGYHQTARAEIHSDLLASRPVAYVAPAPVAKPVKAYVPAPVRRMNPGFDFDGPELGSDLDGPAFVPCRAAIRAEKAGMLISGRNRKTTTPAEIDFADGPEIGWIPATRSSSRF